jgi:hypothetical protein
MHEAAITSFFPTGAWGGRAGPQTDEGRPR